MADAADVVVRALVANAHTFFQPCGCRAQDGGAAGSNRVCFMSVEPDEQGNFGVSCSHCKGADTRCIKVRRNTYAEVRGGLSVLGRCVVQSGPSLPSGVLLRRCNVHASGGSAARASAASLLLQAAPAHGARCVACSRDGGALLPCSTCRRPRPRACRARCCRRFAPVQFCAVREPARP
jgi:hypothetical protein